MKPETAERIASLADLTVPELREVYLEVTGEPTHCRHRTFLQKRLSWLLQARDEGGVTERARRRAGELTRESDLTLLIPKGRTETFRFKPATKDKGPEFLPGTVLRRPYKDRTLVVTVLDKGRFEFNGQIYRSLTAIAKKVTAAHWSGNHFFGLRPRRSK